ncbi:MAG: HAMP domain-containing sensor histidine kinase, partial [Chloroflexi bacterium]|nr:HAMP domain-containing sensor histidine kinase [Chloroflexota bacterium]
MALRHLRASALTRLQGLNSDLEDRLPSNRVVRSAMLVAVYAAAFFPLSLLGGSTAQFFSIIPVVIMATWLGFRGGLVASLLFIPVLVVLISVAQQEPLTYLFYDGRPAAIISLVVMATITGHASDLAHRLDRQLELADSSAQKLRDNCADRDALLKLGVALANAHSVADVHQVADNALRTRIKADRIAIVDVNRESETVLIRYTGGVAVPGFEQGDVYPVDVTWRDAISRHRQSVPQMGYQLPTDSTEQWKTAGFNSVIRIPLWEHDAVSGYIALSSFRSHAFDASDQEFLAAATHYISPHLRAASMLEASIQETRLRRIQIEIARSMAMVSGFKTQCEIASMQMDALCGFDVCLMAETRQGGDQLRIRYCSGDTENAVREGAEFTWDPDLMYLDDEVRYLDLSALELGADAFPFSTLATRGIRYVALVTLVSEGEPLGLLALGSTANNFENEYASALMQSVGSHLANGIVKERAEMEQKRLLRRLEAQNAELRAARERLQVSEEEVRTQNAALQKANEAKNTFLSAVSHELKTPLAIMVGFAELLGMNVPGNLGDQQLQQLRMIERNGRHLDLLVSDLVDVSRIESGRFAVNLEAIQPESVIKEILTGLEAITSEKDQRIVGQYDLEGAWVRADRARLGQVLTNLVSNACKYSPEKTDITVTSAIEDNELVIVVQ